MNAMGAAESGVFVKTSSRSAKDFADPDILRTCFLSKRAEMIRAADGDLSPPDDDDENRNMIAMSYASMELLRMKSPEQVMAIFGKSERIWHDMKLALACDDEDDGGGGGEWAEALAVRRWVHIEPDMEFRCFVCSGTLTAISQYRHLLYFPRLVQHSAQLRQTLCEFVDSIAPRLAGLFPKDDYILDLAVELDPSQSAAGIMDNAGRSHDDTLPIVKTWAIEVNPFFETTDGALYSWTRDAAVLMGSSSDETTGRPDFRFRTQPAKGASSLMYGSWREIMTTTAATAAGQSSLQ